MAQGKPDLSVTARVTVTLDVYCSGTSDPAATAGTIYRNAVTEAEAIVKGMLEHARGRAVIVGKMKPVMVLKPAE